MVTFGGSAPWKLFGPVQSSPIDDTSAADFLASLKLPFASLARIKDSQATSDISAISDPSVNPVPILKPSTVRPNINSLGPSSESFMILFNCLLLFAICILLLIILHLWRRSIMFEEALRKSSPSTYASLQSRFARGSPPSYRSDEESSVTLAPPPYSVSSSQAVESKPQRRGTASAHGVPNYDFLDCDCYDGDSWASLPDEECRCLRTAKN